MTLNSENSLQQTTKWTKLAAKVN